jgi:3-oxoacyl-[acyl-carrier protein] reductase
MSTDLTDRIALVTGASRGIGRAIALALADAGADVAVNYLTSADKAHDVCTLIEKLGRRALPVRADVSRSEDVTRLAKKVEDELGPVAVLVNNAGITRPQALDEIRERDWDEVVTLNLKSCFLVTQAVLPRMRTLPWGRIINLSSVAAQLGGVVGPHYSASKAGILGLTRSYAALLADEAITVNAIAPALVLTDMVRGNPNATTDLIPVGRFGKVEEVSDVALMLARNGYITGQTINVNGGWYMS